MEVELTDEEFERLTDLLLVQHSLPEARMAEGNIIHSLPPLDQDLLKKELIKVNTTELTATLIATYLTVTILGYHVLTNQGLRFVLCLMKLNADHQALVHIDNLSQEELPMLLTHSSLSIRNRAARAMERYQQSGEELWEIFIKSRGHVV